MLLLPAILSFFIAFTRYNGLSNPVYIGWDNFKFLIFIIEAVPLRVLGALGLALLYHRPRTGIGFYRAAVYLPTVIPDAAYALAWTWILNPLYGPLNASLRTLGWVTPPWLADSTWALPSLILVSLF